MNGLTVNTLQQAETFGEYLELKHWGNPTQPYTGNTTPIHPHSPINMGPVTHEELLRILRKMKNHKATGPDDIPAETYKWLN